MALQQPQQERLQWHVQRVPQIHRGGRETKVETEGIEDMEVTNINNINRPNYNGTSKNFN